MAQRVKGQDTSLIIMVDGNLQTRIDTISSAEFEFEMTLLEEEYLGETAMRYDSIYNGIRVEMEYHMTAQQAMELADSIARRARRQAGAPVRIDLLGTFFFPNGDTPSLQLTDLYFDSMPFEIGSRQDYVSGTFTAKCSDYEIL